MSRQPTVPVITPVLLDSGAWDQLKGLGPIEGTEDSVIILNYTTTHIGVYMRPFGLRIIPPLAQSNMNDGVYIAFKHRTFDNRPQHRRVEPNEQMGVDFTRGVVPDEVAGERRVYRKTYFYSTVDLRKELVMYDTETGIYIGLAKCDWSGVGTSNYMEHQNPDDLNKPGFQFSVEYVAPYDDALFYVTMEELIPVHSVRPEVARKQPGIYVAITDHVTGKLNVKFYTSCELCRNELKIAVFGNRGQATDFLLSKGGGKKAGGSDSALIDGIMQRAKMTSDKAQSKARTKQAAPPPPKGEGVFDTLARILNSFLGFIQQLASVVKAIGAFA